ncbi:hypothetical protein GDO86_004432 [Hymenochirus boettgeri]|uniref:Uncharacterized protein n=1 Tax=Hymenochirus boettgeri TaxID=247094 RepID=A0A8T2KDG0_9PIPI|nr:hypothetical protein GDO86_004432 [Hymenochirus boettgeri]
MRVKKYCDSYYQTSATGTFKLYTKFMYFSSTLIKHIALSFTMRSVYIVLIICQRWLVWGAALGSYTSVICALQYTRWQLNSNKFSCHLVGGGSAYHCRCL